MKKFLAMALAGSVLPVWAAGEARWISYPGDYGIWWGNELQSQRLQWGSRLTPFWPMYEPHTRVLFRKDNLDIREDEELEVPAASAAAVETGFEWESYDDGMGFEDRGVMDL